MKITKIYYEKEIKKYKLGREILDKYQSLDKIEIVSHNNIEELRKNKNEDFIKMKSYLILGIRKSLKYVENHKVSDYLVPFTSTGCMAMCLYCYLVCHFNKCSYLRIFVNVEEIMDKLIKKSNASERECIYEIGSNSDLILENEITNNLEYVINRFGKEGKGYITFPTKFDMVDSILNLNHNGKCIIRMSVNPKKIIKEIEIGTSNLDERIEAIKKLYQSGYKVGILIAPVIMVSNYLELYKELIEYLHKNLPEEIRKEIFFEVIFMTYSYVHNEINKDAFKKELLDKTKMKSSGYGKYRYKDNLVEEGKIYIENLLNIYFEDSEIKYIV